MQKLDRYTIPSRFAALASPEIFKYCVPDFTIEYVTDIVWDVLQLPAPMAERITIKADELTMRIHTQYNVPSDLRVLFLLAVLYYIKIEDDDAQFAYNPNFYMGHYIRPDVLYKLECIFLQFLWTIL